MVRESDRERDADLVTAGLSGDRKALEELVGQYYRPIYKVAFRILNDAEASADVTQMTFLSAFEKLHSYDPSYKFFSWICRIAINHSLELTRRRGLAEQKAHLELVRHGPEDPGERLAEEESGQAVSRMLMALNEDNRIVLVLRHYSELSYDEIANVLKIPVKTVRSRLYSARQQLKTELKRSGHEP